MAYRRRRHIVKPPPRPPVSSPNISYQGWLLEVKVATQAPRMRPFPQRCCLNGNRDDAREAAGLLEIIYLFDEHDIFQCKYVCKWERRAKGLCVWGVGGEGLVEL